MNGSLMSRMATLARAQLAMTLTAADGMQRYVEVTARYGEDLIGAVGAIARDAGDTKACGWDRAAARALAGYRDYLRELAALPGIASMHYYEQLGELRGDDGAKNGVRSRRPGTPVPPPTASMLALASALAASAPPSSLEPQTPPA